MQDSIPRAEELGKANRLVASVGQEPISELGSAVALPFNDVQARLRGSSRASRQTTPSGEAMSSLPRTSTAGMSAHPDSPYGAKVDHLNV